MAANPYFDFQMANGRLLVRGDQKQLLLMARAFELAAETGDFHTPDGTLVITRIGAADVPLLTVH